MVAEITRESYPGLKHFAGRCTAEGCVLSHSLDRWDTEYPSAFFHGAYKQHVADTGHRVVVEEVEG